MTETYDYVIVGGGTAACVIANRLTELADATVLMLEAGGAEVNDAVEDPARWNEVLLTELDWAYMSEPQPGLDGRRVYSASGRGPRRQLERLPHDAHPGPAGGLRRLGGQRRGRLGVRRRPAVPAEAGGPARRHQPDGRPGRADHRGERQGHRQRRSRRRSSTPASSSATRELDDFNAGAFGAGWHHVDIRDGKRCGVRVGYLEPALGRPNLTVRTGALASALEFDGRPVRRRHATSRMDGRRTSGPTGR